MATFTEHLGLHQWVAEDNFLRTDFNADFLAIDQAVHQAQTSLDGRIDTVNAALDTKIDSVNSTLDGKINSVNSTLDGKINTVNSTLNSKIDSTKTSLTNTINTEKQALNTTITNTKNALQADIDETMLLCRVVTGTYTGQINMNIGGLQTQAINLGFRPKGVLILPKDYNFAGRGVIVALAVDGYNLSLLTITNTGFTVSGTLNTQEDGDTGQVYPRNPFRYLAWR